MTLRDKIDFSVHDITVDDTGTSGWYGGVTYFNAFPTPDTFVAVPQEFGGPATVDGNGLLGDVRWIVTWTAWSASGPDGSMPIGGDTLTPELAQRFVRAEKISGPSHGTVGPIADDGSFTYTAEAGYLGTDSFSYALYDRHPLPEDQGDGEHPPGFLGEAFVTIGVPPQVDLDLLAAAGPLAESDEERPGGLAYLNVDDDDGDGVRDDEDSLVVGGDDDLVRLLLRKSDNSPPGSTFALDFDPTAVRLYRTAEKVDELFPGGDAFGTDQDTVVFAEPLRPGRHAVTLRLDGFTDVDRVEISALQLEILTRDDSTGAIYEPDVIYPSDPRPEVELEIVDTMLDQYVDDGGAVRRFVHVTVRGTVHDRIDPAALRRQVGDVGHPFADGSLGGEVPGQRVGRRRPRRIGLGRRRRESPRDSVFQALLSHRLSYRVTAGGFQIVAFFERLGNLRAAVDAVRVGMDLGDGLTDAGRALGPLARRAIKPGVITGGRGLRHPAGDGHGERVAMFADPNVFHCDSFAKYAVAFLRSHAPSPRAATRAAAACSPPAIRPASRLRRTPSASAPSEHATAAAPANSRRPAWPPPQTNTSLAPPDAPRPA